MVALSKTVPPAMGIKEPEEEGLTLGLKLKQVVEELDLKVLTGEKLLNREIKGGYTSDLLSWVMSHAKEGSLWVTVQSHQNIVAIASLLDLAGIIVAEGVNVEPKTREKSEQEKVCILTTDKNSFEISGLLYKLGIGS